MLAFPSFYTIELGENRMEVKGEIFHENVMDAPKTNKATNTPFFKKLNRIHNLLKRKI